MGAETNDTEIATDEPSKDNDNKNIGTVYKVQYEEAAVDKYLKEEVEMPSHVRKMIEVSNKPESGLQSRLFY